MTSPTIMLIDDDADLLQAVGNRCRNLGFEVVHARNLLTATALIGRHVPDVLCVDVEMPTGNGLDFCEAILTDPRTVHLPIIVLTGQRDTATIEACRQMHAQYLFKSPDVWSSLETLLRQYLPTNATDRKPNGAGLRPINYPARPIPPQPAESDAGKSRDSGAGKASSQLARQIVVADDDADLVRLLLQRFGSLGCSAIGVDNVISAINAIHRAAPDLVVLDVNMPSGNGLSVCEMMSTNQRMRQTPVIILTGQSDPQTIRRCHDMLVFYVQKGGDIWSRVEPLVRELLHLGDATGQSKLNPPPVEASMASPSTPAQDHRDLWDKLLDAVFSMLGVDSGSKLSHGRHDVIDANDASETVDASAYITEPEEVPWVLCIDDDPDFIEAIRFRLEEHGVAVARAASGMEGYCMAFASPASAILLDYSMPNGQGDYILGRLKDNPVTRSIPVFMITGAKDKQLERRIMSMGAAGYFEKPLHFDELRDQLARYIDILAKPAHAVAQVNEHR